MRTQKFIAMHKALLILCCINLIAAQVHADERALLVEPKASQKWVILIGVDDYINVRKLNYCGNDMSALQKQFIAAGFRKDHVILMHENVTDNRYHPFKSNIESELNLLLGELNEKGTGLIKRGLVEKGDMIIIAFSGHGIHPAGGKQSFFCPADAVIDRAASMVSLERLYKQLELCPAGIKLLMVDACRNDPRPEGAKAMRATDETKGFAKTLDNPPAGILVLSSCAPGQVSWEDHQIEHGVFMNYILKGLQGAADTEEGNRNQKVSLLELYKYAYNNTKTYVYRNKRKIQTPSLKGNITGDFEFGLLTSLSPSPLSTPKPSPAMRPVSSQPALLIAPFNKQEATAKQTAWAKHLKREVIETNELGMKMVLIPPGEFTMGSPDSELRDGIRREKNESPQHKVQITKPFYLAATEVTQKQWESVIKTTPWEEEPFDKERADYAATDVSWKDAQEYVKKLSSLEGKTYRLPTEAEWEYACRAGSVSRYCFGESTETLKEYAWFNENALLVNELYAHQVGRKLANSFGLFDMHGNVDEWCSDWCDYHYYGTFSGKTARDPAGPAGSSRVLRGGSWGSGPRDHRSAHRSSSSQTNRSLLVGFRVVCVVE